MALVAAGLFLSSTAGGRGRKDAPRLVATGLVAALCAAIVPPLSMVCLWAALSGAPRTLAFDALAWWGPMAGLGGLVFWLIAGRPRRRRRR